MLVGMTGLGEVGRGVAGFLQLVCLSAALAGAVPAVHPRPAAAADATPQLPSGSKVGAMHRDASGKLVVEEPAQPGPSAAPGPAPSPASGKPVTAPAAPAKAPAAVPREAAAPTPAANDKAPIARAGAPDELDDASCRAYAWLPAMTYESCRRDLKAARERAGGAGHRAQAQ
jgi:hypothetical protein